MLEILDHPNPDIWIESITLLSEITDEETLNEKPQLALTIDILTKNEIWNFLARLIVNLNDDEEEERKLLFKCLTFIENLMDQQASTFSNKLMSIDTFIDWLLDFLKFGDVKSENYL